MKFESKRFILGVFEDDDHLVHALTELKKNSISVYDVFTPFAVHGLDELLDIKRSRLPIVGFFGGIFGLSIGLWFQIWTSSTDWPLNIGGKPFNSLPAFIPVTFEVAILCAALFTVAAFFVRSKLGPGIETYLAHEELTDNKFVIAIEEHDAGLDIAMIENIFRQSHVLDILSKEGREWCKK